MTTLPDEILSEILSPALRVSEEVFSNAAEKSPFARYSLSTSTLLLVCRDWLRVATPLLYIVVILRSKAQAQALEKVLLVNPDFGLFIKKLRVEGGYGPAMHTILKSAPNITHLFLSFAIWSSDNPVTSRKITHNKPLTTLRDVFFTCLPKWKNLTVFDFPYSSSATHGHPAWEERANLLIAALAKSLSIQTVIVPDFLPSYFASISDIPTVRVLQIQKPLTAQVLSAIRKINDPKLKKILKYTEKKNKVWGHIFFFLFCIDEECFPRKPPTPHPSRYPVLLVSKAFSEIALPYFYRCPSLIMSRKISSFSQQLCARPTLGRSIRFLCLDHIQIPDSILLPILLRATRLEKKSGSTLQEVSVRLNSSLNTISTSMFLQFTKLRYLHLEGSMKFVSDAGTCQVSENALPELETLCIERCDSSLLDALSEMRLPSLRKASLPPTLFGTGIAVCMTPFLGRHGDKILNLRVSSLTRTEIFDTCSNLLTIGFHGPSLYKPDTFSCKAPHESLIKLTFSYLFLDKDAVLLQTIDYEMFPALREIQVCSFEWPTTERDISKSLWVQSAELLFERNIKLTDRFGQRWTSRLKSTRR
ncbi:hypothetical protein B0H10DRAFT_2046830 [Mycena sp. CBHHK59/15]|nr:hypothetical protein B0H10DRAFT_2046830 [Mycena sp. CBHHK59/15]